jgi:hypothetical protein
VLKLIGKNQFRDHSLPYAIQMHRHPVDADQVSACSTFLEIPKPAQCGFLFGDK